MLGRVKNSILNSPLETFARRLYIRLDQNDRDTLAVMRRWLRKNSNCVDIGAHRGSILREIVSLAPEGIHYAFEPVSKHYQYLCHAFPNVNIFSYALSNIQKQEQFVHNLSHPTRSGFQRLVSSELDNTEMITVETTLLDQVIPIDLRVDFIKLDVEGAEALVIEGGLQTIKRNRPVIVFEHGKSFEIDSGSPSLKIFQLLVQEAGLQISSLSDWLHRRAGMSLEEFLGQVDQEKLFYFIAYPA